MTLRGFKVYVHTYFVTNYRDQEQTLAPKSYRSTYLLSSKALNQFSSISHLQYSETFNYIDFKYFSEFSKYFYKVYLAFANFTYFSLRNLVEIIIELLL